MTKIIAHRGASRLAPENTMPAFKLALQLGAEAIETDVHLTKDYVPILMHDQKVNRTTNGAGYLHRLTYNELANLDAGSWFSKRFEQTKIVPLETFLKWARTNTLQINLELKNSKFSYPYLENIVYEMINYFNLQDRTTISTFSSESIQYMATFKHPLSLAYLRSRRLKDLVDYTEQIKAQALHIHYRLLTKKIIHQCSQKNLKLRVYTVNKFHQMVRCFRLKCHGIFTDIPDRALYYRKGYLLNKQKD